MSQEKLNNSKNLFFISLIADMAANAVSITLNTASMNIANNALNTGYPINQSILESSELWDRISSIDLITAICVGIALICWLTQCYEFAKHTLKATGFEQEKWKIWGWLVPFYNVFKPYQVINELYKAGSTEYSDGIGWRKIPGSGWLLTWWIFWLFTHMIMFGLGKFIWKQWGKQNFNLNDAVSFYQSNIALSVIALIVAPLWFVVAEKITKRLSNRANQTVWSRATVSIDYSYDPANRPKHQGGNYTEEDLYEIASNEIASGTTKPGMMAKAFAESDGDERRSTARYLQLRVASLKEELLLMEREMEQPLILHEKYEEKAPSSASPASTPSYKENVSSLLLCLAGVIVFLGLIWEHNSSREQDEVWINNVKQVKDSIASGQLNVITASSKYFSSKDGVSIYQLNNFKGEPYSEAAISALERENIWWLENYDLFVRVKNNSNKPLSSILFEIFYENCSVQDAYFKEYHLFVFEKKISPYTQSVVKTKPNLVHTEKVKNNNLCGTIVSAW